MWPNIRKNRGPTLFVCLQPEKIINAEKNAYREYIYIYKIYNSVLTCRQNIINSSASGPLNATKIAVKKVSDVFGVFLCESARTAAQSRTNLSTNSGKATKRLGRLAPNLAHVQIHMGMDMLQTNCPSRHKWVTWGGGDLGGQQFKRMGKLNVRLAPTLVHVCGFIWEWT